MSFQTGGVVDKRTVMLPGIKSTLQIQHPALLNNSGNKTSLVECREEAGEEAAILITLASIGIAANILPVALIAAKRELRR